VLQNSLYVNKSEGGIEIVLNFMIVKVIKLTPKYLYCLYGF